MDKKFPDKAENPETKPVYHKPDKVPSMDSRDGHGLSKTEALKGKS